jgi:hypothetical protein
MGFVCYRHAIPLGFLTVMTVICYQYGIPMGFYYIFKFWMCGGKSHRDDMSVEKQSEINKNPGGMACKIIIFDVSSRWDS